MPYSAQVSPGRFSKKAEEIDRILNTPDVDLWRLRELALSEGGLVNDALRTRAWPKLLGVVDLRDNSEDGSCNHDIPPGAEEDEEENGNDYGDILINPAARVRGDSSWIKSSSVSSSRSPARRGGSESSSIPQQQQQQLEDSVTQDSSHLQNFLEQQNRQSSSGRSSSSSNHIQTTDDAGSGWTHVHNTQQRAAPSLCADDELEEFSTSSTAAFSTASTVSVFNTSPSHKSRSSFRRRSTGRGGSLGVAARSLDAKQIELDVHRCTWHLLTGNQRTQRLQMEHKRNRRVAKLIRRKQRRLANLLNLTLLQSYNDAHDASDRLRYYQGYHDVACIFLSTLGGAAKAHPLILTNNHNNSNLEHADGSDINNNAYVGLTVPSLGTSAPEALAAQLGIDLPAKLLVRVSQSPHLRDYLKANFVELQTAIRLTVFPLLALLDPQVHEHLYEAQMEPFFALSWLITWFSHEIRDTELVKRLFDAFLVSHPLFPIYVAIAMCVHPVNRQEILESECDFAVLHQLLRGLPRNSSMVGWKYRPGDGYVSDDEEDDDDDDDDSLMQTASVDGDFAVIREELLNTREVGEEEEPAGAQSSVSTAGGSATEAMARVPFQELIDLALLIVKRKPPRKLLSLSTRYYGEATVQEYLSQAPNMSLFADLPEWSVAPYADADSVLLQRVMAGEPLFSTTSLPREDPVTVARIIREKQYSPAVVALGLGCAGMEAARRKRKRKRILVAAISIAIVAVAIGIAVHQQRQQRQQQQQQKHLGPSSSISAAAVTGLPPSSTVSTSADTNMTATTQPVGDQRMEPSPIEARKMDPSSTSETESYPTMIVSSPTKLTPVQATHHVRQQMVDVKSSSSTRSPSPGQTTGRSGRPGMAPSADMGGATRQHQMSWWMMPVPTGFYSEGDTADTVKSGKVHETKILPIASTTKSDANVKVKGSRHTASDSSRLPMASSTGSNRKKSSSTIINAAEKAQQQPARVVVHRTSHVSMGYGDSSSKVEAYGGTATSRWATDRLGAVGRSLSDVGLFRLAFRRLLGILGSKKKVDGSKPPMPPHCGSELSLEKPGTVGLCFLELNQQFRNEWIHTQKLTRSGLSRLMTVVNRRFIQAWNHTKEVTIQKVGHALEGAPEKLSTAVDKALNNVFPSSPVVVRNITQAVKDFEMEQLVRKIIYFLKRAVEMLNRPLSEGLKLVVSWLNEPFKFK